MTELAASIDLFPSATPEAQPRTDAKLTNDLAVAKLPTARKVAEENLKMWRWAVLLLAVGTLPARAQAPQAMATESKLIALENAWNQAQIHHDAGALQNLVSEHFIYTDTDGTVMNKAQFLADAKDLAYKAVSATNDDLKIDLYENTAVVSGRYHTKGTYKAKPFDHYGRFTDTWVYLSGQWQCVASHTTLVQHK